jgi:hypothetical protein
MRRGSWQRQSLCSNTRVRGSGYDTILEQYARARDILSMIYIFDIAGKGTNRQNWLVEHEEFFRAVKMAKVAADD